MFSLDLQVSYLSYNLFKELRIYCNIEPMTCSQRMMQLSYTCIILGVNQSFSHSVELFNAGVNFQRF